MPRSFEAGCGNPEPSPVPQEILAHYQEGREAERLSRHLGALEFERTQEILARFMPPPPAVVLDVGGAAGIHAVPLARRGYQVHLLDPVALHVEQAKAASAAHPDAPLAACTIGDARALPVPDCSVDTVLLLGPLYHLTERTDRVTALREARRALRPDGILFAATISRFASLFDGFARDLIADRAFVDILRRDLRDGQHRNPTLHPDWFTTAFFHHPDELRAEIAEAELHLTALVGLEGPTWALRNFDHHWSDPARRQQLLDLIRSIESDEAVLATSFHPLVVARRSS